VAGGAKPEGSPRRRRRRLASRWLIVLQDSVDVFLVAAGLLLVLRDLTLLGLGTANGRTVSFFDSLLNCYEFRAQEVLTPVSAKTPPRDAKVRRGSIYHMTSTHVPWWWRLRTFVLSFVLKFGSSTFVSVCLWRRPVVLKGSRHFISFILSLLLIQFFPYDWAFKKIQSSHALELVIRAGTTLYKFRKTMFVVEVFRGRTAASSILSSVVLAVITVDGNGLARNVENVLCNRGLATSCKSDVYHEILCALSFFWHRNWSVILTTLMLWVVQTTNPWMDPRLGRGAVEVQDLLKFLGLILFLHRNKVLQLAGHLVPTPIQSEKAKVA